MERFDISVPPPSRRLLAVRPASQASFFYEIHWVITRRCTYACSYCPPHRHDATAPEATSEVLLAGMTRLASLIGSRQVRINFTGGEPTRHPGLVTLVEHALSWDGLRYCRILSNMSMPVRVYEALGQVAASKPGRLQVVASFHPASAKERAFIERVQLLLESGVDVLVKYLVDPASSHDASGLGAALESLRLRHASLYRRPQLVRGAGIDVRPFAIDIPPPHWGDTRLAVSEASNVIGQEECTEFEAWIASGQNRLRGWRCATGSSALFIDHDGAVYSALCKPERMPLFRLFDPHSQAQIPCEPVICPHERCECSASLRIPKERP